jgi:MGT family glycosyltransferase
MEAFADSLWQVVMAIGQTPRTALETVPDNFIVQASVPQLDLLRRTTLFITHGGMNSVSEALFSDVPLLIVPQWADQFWIAQRAAELGAAQVLPNEQVTSEQLRQSVEHIAAHREYAEAARKIGTSLRMAGGVQKAVDVIEAFKQASEREEKQS